MDTDSAIRERKTTKVLAHSGQLPCPTPPSAEADPIHQGHVGKLLELAGMAPFHRACDEVHRSGEALKGIEPWRFHVLLAQDCRALSGQLDSEQAGKIPAMLSAADCLILATWLPNPPSPEFQCSSRSLFEPTLANMEHIAAASSAVQNLLLAATSRGIQNYWSSGGVLRTEAMQKLGIANSEILIGAIFLFPTETGSAEVVGSKLRDKRTSAEHWSRQVKVE